MVVSNFLRYPKEAEETVVSMNMIDEKKGPNGCLVYIGDEILPSYGRITINHDIRIPINTTRIHWKIRSVFFVAHMNTIC